MREELHTTLHPFVFDAGEIDAAQSDQQAFWLDANSIETAMKSERIRRCDILNENKTKLKLKKG